MNSNQYSFKFSETEFDFGDLTIEQLPVSHEFQITNLSNTELYILQVCSVCPCVSVKFDKTSIKKDSFSSITATFHSYIDIGKFNKSLVIYLSNQQQPIRLKITGKIVSK